MGVLMCGRCGGCEIMDDTEDGLLFMKLLFEFKLWLIDIVINLLCFLGLLL